MRVIQTDDVQELHALAKQLATSKRVAIICGAGISTAAGIPDFRSATTGLFASLKEKNPELKINSGKDLFHTNLFQVGRIPSLFDGVVLLLEQRGVVTHTPRRRETQQQHREKQQ